MYPGTGTEQQAKKAALGLEVGYRSGPTAPTGNVQPGPSSLGPAWPKLSASSDAPFGLFYQTLEDMHFQWLLLSFAHSEAGGHCSREGRGRYSYLSGSGRPVSLGLQC